MYKGARETAPPFFSRKTGIRSRGFRSREGGRFAAAALVFHIEPGGSRAPVKTLRADADMETVSVTISPPIRVFALLGALAATGLAAFLFLVGRSGSETVPVTRPVVKTRPVVPKTPAKTPQRTQQLSVQTKSGFPLPVDRALRRHRVVVVVVYMPGSGVDSVVRAEARAGARRSRAGFVAISALSEPLVRPLVAKTGVLPDPAVVIVKRPGVVTATFGVTDRETVAQAVAQAKR